MILFQLSGGLADIDGRIMRGDFITSINGQNVENTTSEEVGAILKVLVGRAFLKLNRHKIISR